MEMEALEAGQQLLTRHHPILVVEIIKTDRTRLAQFLTSLGYRAFPLGRLDIVAAHETDKTLRFLEAQDWSKEVF